LSRHRRLSNPLHRLSIKYARKGKKGNNQHSLPNNGVNHGDGFGPLANKYEIGKRGKTGYRA